MKTSSKYIICFDTETGGLISKDKPAFTTIPLMEIALVVINMESLSVEEKKSFIIERDYKEGLIYSKEAEEVHGITEELQREKGISIKELYKELKNLFSKYKNPRQLSTLVGHNIVGFDVPFLVNFFSYMKDDLNNYVKFYLDTMQMAHMMNLEQQDYKLHTCCNLFNIDLVNAHRALDDTEANALLFIEMIKRLRGIGIDKKTENIDNKKSSFRERFQL